MKKSILIILLFVSAICNAQYKDVTGMPLTTHGVNVTIREKQQAPQELACDSIQLNGNKCTPVNLSGGSPPYTYTWNTIPIQTTRTAIINESGTYCVVIGDSNKSAILRIFEIK